MNLHENIKKYREIKGLTQQELSNILNISPQAISKWELGKAEPDSNMLQRLASVFEVDINQIVGYVYNIREKTIYNDEYDKVEYYWGKKHSQICLDVLKYKPPIRKYEVLDIGCGEGQNVVFLAQCGYEVTAFDISDKAINKAKNLSKENNVEVDLFIADINAFKLASKFDIIISSGVLQYILLDMRNEIMENLMEYTNPNGIHIHNAFIKKPFIDDPPEKEPIFNYFKSGELFTYYNNWEILECSEYIFSYNSSGIPYKHCMNKVIGRKRDF